MNKIFGYNETATRAELAEMIMRVVEYREDADAFKEKRKLEVEAIINQFVEDLKSGKTGVGEKDFHKVGREIAEKYGLTVDTTSKNYVTIKYAGFMDAVSYGNDGSYTMSNGNVEMGLELMQRLEGYSDSEISKIRDTIYESEDTSKRIFIEIRDKRAQIQKFGKKGDTFVDILNRS